MLDSKQVIILRLLSFSADVHVQVDYTTGFAKPEVKISNIIDLCIKPGFSDLFDLYLRNKLIAKNSLQRILCRSSFWRSV